MLSLLLASAAAPVAAQLPDPLEATVDPADRAVMAEAASAVSGRPPDIARLDAVLAKLPRPTPLRGMVQTVRAGLLAASKDAGPAVAAIEEGLRLLPDDPRPKIVATGIFTFAGSPQRAADLWMQASRESPDFARLSDRYVMSALVGRLQEIGDRVRADRLSARLGEIGFSAGLAPERSAAALARVRGDMQAGQVADAIQGVTAIGDPSDLLGLYIDRRYEALWPRIAEWAGPTLDAQLRRYLEELRSDWTATNDFETATPYARQLAGLGSYAAITSLFLPMFDRVEPGPSLNGIEFLAPIVARALTRQGKSSEAQALLAKVAAAMPSNDSGADLNIAGAYLTLDMNEQRWPEAVAHADRFLTRARALGPTVNRSAVLNVQELRACALWQMGRKAESEQDTAATLLAEAVLPGTAFHLHLCRGDVAAARALILRRLADEATRGWALAAMQLKGRDPFTPFERAIEPTAQAVRTAPDVQAAVAKVGRVLPQPVLFEVPAGFDPYRARSPARPLRPGEV